MWTTTFSGAAQVVTPRAVKGYSPILPSASMHYLSHWSGHRSPLDSVQLHQKQPGKPQPYTDDALEGQKKRGFLRQGNCPKISYHQQPSFPIRFLKRNIYISPHHHWSDRADLHNVAGLRVSQQGGQSSLNTPCRALPVVYLSSSALRLLPIGEQPTGRGQTTTTAVTALNAHDPAMSKCWCFCSCVLQQDQLPGGRKGITPTISPWNARGTWWHNSASALVLLESPGSFLLSRWERAWGRGEMSTSPLAKQ